MIKIRSGTSASFGVNCDMPGLHFPDTCVTDLGNTYIWSELSSLP